MGFLLKMGYGFLNTMRGIQPDHIDEVLEDMMMRTVAGEVIGFDEWQDLVDDVEEDNAQAPDFEAILQKYGLTPQELAEQSEAGRADFLERLHKFDLSIDNRFVLCQRLCGLAKTNPSDELLRLYCDIVFDNGFLLDLERTEDEEASICWLYGRENSDILYRYLSERRGLAARFRELLEQVKKIKLSAMKGGENDPAESDAVFQSYVRIFEFSDSGTRLLDNIAWLLRAADRNPALRKIKPLLLYRMLTRHGKRMQTSDDLRVDCRTLWKYQTYNINKDNGKNYRMNVRYLTLFSELCSICEADGQVDIPLCVYGFDHLSNLGKFYRDYVPEGVTIPFGFTLEDIMMDSQFSCFENGYDDSVAATYYEIPVRKLERFECSSERRHSRALTRIEKYMNQRLVKLMERFLNADTEGVKLLCSEILEASELPTSQQPKNEAETALFLAAINGALMEAVDDLAEDYLVQAGYALIGEEQQ